MTKTKSNENSPANNQQTESSSLLTPTETTHGRRNVLSFFAVILALIAIAASLYFWREANNYGIQNKMVMTQLQEAASQQRKQITDLQTQIQSSQHELQDQKKIATENQQTLQHLVDVKSNNNQSWILAQVNHLLRLAQYNLNFQQDIVGTITLLKSAAQQLDELDDPETLELRQTIANNMAALQAIPPVDTASLLIKLNALSLQIPTMPLMTEKLGPANNASVTPSPVNGWRKYLHQSLQNLEALIVIRHRDAPLEPLMSPEQQINLSQFVQAKLNQAAWAVLHHNQSVYQTSLTQAQTWIEKYYAPDAATTLSVVNQLKQLSAVNLAPQLPDLTNTINLSQKLMTSSDEKISK